ncbi:isoprenylcysteine carboxylmethyltransferase family protein [Rhodobacterales bacterium HKCCE2091]|nr:isoprenylcysteine carboxylmethyltransferase family protein [Rhodobacterales bacterium HKCCE2091]
MKGFPDLPPIWLAGFMVLAWALARYLPILSLASGPLRLLGTVLALMGLAVIAWSAIYFWRAKTSIEPHEEPTSLLTDGPYRLSRNPIYLGMVAILAGEVLWLGALSAVILPGIYAGLVSVRFILPEEARLVEHFGDEARAFMARTRRWI